MSCSHLEMKVWNSKEKIRTREINGRSISIEVIVEAEGMNKIAQENSILMDLGSHKSDILSNHNPSRTFHLKQFSTVPFTTEGHSVC